MPMTISELEARVAQWAGEIARDTIAAELTFAWHHEREKEAIAEAIWDYLHAQYGSDIRTFQEAEEARSTKEAAAYEQQVRSDYFANAV